MSDRDCTHGRLARKCEICELMECERLLDAKEQECAELRKDAERYRWLRDEKPYGFAHLMYVFDRYLPGGERFYSLDKAIDAARNHGQEKTDQ